MNKRKKKRLVIKPRFYVICTLLIAVITSLIIFNLSSTLGNEEVPEKITLLSPMEIIKEEAPVVTVEDIPITIQPKDEVKFRYGFTDEDIYLLAQVLSGGKNIDGDGEYDIDFQNEINYYEVGKVLSVIMNRVRSESFPDTVKDVVMQKGQFSVMPRNANKEPSDITLQTVREWCTAYDNYIKLVQVVPENHLYFRGDSFTNTTRARFND